MYEFIFRIDGQIHFRCKLESIRCKDLKDNGQRCKRQTVMGSSYCYSHLLYKHKLRIKASNIADAGLGLFALDPFTNAKVVVFNCGDTIIKYSGEIIDEEELIERYDDKTPPYAIGISRDRYEDGAKVRGVGALANTFPNHQNATISVYQGFASLKATKTIYNGDEIYLSYGKSHKLNQTGVNHSTTKK